MHPPEPIYPCYLPVLGEFNRMTPHEGPSTSLPELGYWFESAQRAVENARRRVTGLVPYPCPSHPHRPELSRAGFEPRLDPDYARIPTGVAQAPGDGRCQVLVMLLIEVVVRKCHISTGNGCPVILEHHVQILSPPTDIQDTSFRRRTSSGSSSSSLGVLINRSTNRAEATAPPVPWIAFTAAAWWSASVTS